MGGELGRERVGGDGSQAGMRPTAPARTVHAMHALSHLGGLHRHKLAPPSTRLVALQRSRGFNSLPYRQSAHINSINQLTAQNIWSSAYSRSNRPSIYGGGTTKACLYCGAFGAPTSGSPV